VKPKPEEKKTNADSRIAMAFGSGEKKN